LAPQRSYPGTFFSPYFSKLETEQPIEKRHHHSLATSSHFSPLVYPERFWRGATRLPVEVGHFLISAVGAAPYPVSLFHLSNFYFPFSKGGRSFPAASLASARNRPLSSPVLKRPSRQSQRRKSSARRSPFCELHSAHEDTRFR
jgi:hypothetical protein